MRIAIIGGGWVGCHLAYKLKEYHDVHIFEKNSNLFTETSYKNQNRLHLGFHYARSYETRELCQTTFDRFINDYEFATENVDKNLYCIASNKSLIDYKTYLKIFEDFEYKIVDHDFEMFDGCINTKEKYINFIKIHRFFNENLKYKQMVVTRENIKELQKEYDLVINATNNHISDKEIKNFYYELTLSLIYKKKKKTSFDSLTVVDGNLFSIYPYQEDLFTVTDVEYTPIERFKKIKQLNKFSKDIVNSSIIEIRKELIESKIIKYYPNFLNDFEYNSYITSTKSKLDVSSDSRYPIITESGNLINCFTGKIQGIYLIEDYIKKITNGKNATI